MDETGRAAGCLRRGRMRRKGLLRNANHRCGERIRHVRHSTSNPQLYKHLIQCQRNGPGKMAGSAKATLGLFSPASYPFHLVALWAIICMRYSPRTSVSNIAPSMRIRQPDSSVDSLTQCGSSSLGTNTKTADLNALGVTAIQNRD